MFLSYFYSNTNNVFFAAILTRRMKVLRSKSCNWNSFVYFDVPSLDVRVRRQDCSSFLENFCRVRTRVWKSERERIRTEEWKQTGGPVVPLSWSRKLEECWLTRYSLIWLVKGMCYLIFSSFGHLTDVWWPQRLLDNPYLFSFWRSISI